MTDFETMPVGTAAVLVEAMMKLSFHAGIFGGQAQMAEHATTKQSREEHANEAHGLAVKILALLRRSHAAAGASG